MGELARELVRVDEGAKNAERGGGEQLQVKQVARDIHEQKPACPKVEIEKAERPTTEGGERVKVLNREVPLEAQRGQSNQQEIRRAAKASLEQAPLLSWPRASLIGRLLSPERTVGGCERLLPPARCPVREQRLSLP